MKQKIIDHIVYIVAALGALSLMSAVVLTLIGQKAPAELWIISTGTVPALIGLLGKLDQSPSNNSDQ